MNPANLFLGGSYILISFVLIGLSIPLLHRKIPMNQWYGVRIPQSLESEERWYAINEMGAREMIYCGVVLLLMAAVIFLLPLSKEQPWIIILAAFFPLLPLFVMTVRILMKARSF
ncbi:MAG TPA: SdpI family protein [Thermoanaerobaculia bacterium]|nr:SdpI family protein [Thermoanaerobaculia bacterium]HUM30214.1 SdpI family protein [Thermoanaerobaculia bacterium]HXK68337.1 SdpI family protein [Thermoanaerobaculia bacterium]